nr:hypothetical protein [Streptomyces actuosus]
MSLPQTAWYDAFSKNAKASTKYNTTREGNSRTRCSRAPVSSSTASTRSGSMTCVNSPS